MITTDESMPLYLGLAVVVIILIAFFSKCSNSDAEVSNKGVVKKKETVATAASKKSKKGKKSSSAPKQQAVKAPPVASNEEKKKSVTINENPPPPQSAADAEVEPSTATKKKKKKSKKKSASNTETNDDKAASSKNGSATTSILKTPVLVDEDDDESDDDVDLWRLQSAAKRKGANDAAKRAAANKERERERRQQALKKKEEQEKAEAEEKARKEREEAEAAAAAQAAAEAEAKLLAAKAAEEKSKKNGASVAATNGEAADGTEGKKKRKRKKKKAVAEEETVKKPPTTPVEHWETVPIVEEWQEVGHKKAKQKAKVDTNAASDEVVFSEGVSDEPPAVEETGEISVTLAAGDDPLIFIGKGGATIQNLQDVTGARFHLNRVTNVLTISGLEECVQQGLEEARAILAAEAERKANEATEKVNWGSDAIKAVIGKGGANIRATQDATGVRIDADVDAGTLVIVGPREQVSTALTMCHNAAFGEAQDVLELGSRNAVNVVYGPNFQTIRELQDSTGCKLDIERGSTTLKLSGSNEAVAEALARIRALLDSNRGFEMTIENAKVGAVYGKGGETLRSIQDRTGVQIDVVRGPTHATVSVMGTAESSERARLMLQRAIDGEAEVAPGEVAESIELGSATAAVIGRGGSNVADLEKRHGVKINVRSDLRVGRIVGRPEKVAAASKEIRGIIKPILDAEEAQKKADEAVQSGESAWQVDDDADDADGW